jgi:hypothetical protein
METGIEYGYTIPAASENHVKGINDTPFINSPEAPDFSKLKTANPMLRRSREQIIHDIKERIQKLDNMQNNEPSRTETIQLPEISDFSNTIETSSIPTPRLTNEVDTFKNAFTETISANSGAINGISPTEKNQFSNITLIKSLARNINSVKIEYEEVNHTGKKG